MLDCPDDSHIAARRASSRQLWPTNNAAFRCIHLHCRGSDPDFLRGFLDHGAGQSYQRLWCRHAEHDCTNLPSERVQDDANNSLRSLLLAMYVYTCADLMKARSTGFCRVHWQYNWLCVFGGGSESILLSRPVDRLCLLLYPIRLVLARPIVHSVHRGPHSCVGQLCRPRVSSVGKH